VPAVKLKNDLKILESWNCRWNLWKVLELLRNCQKMPRKSAETRTNVVLYSYEVPPFGLKIIW